MKIKKMLEELKNHQRFFFLNQFFVLLVGTLLSQKVIKNLFWKGILIVFKAKQMQDDMNLAIDTYLEFVYSYFLWERTLDTVFPMADVYTAEKQS